MGSIYLMGLVYFWGSILFLLKSTFSQDVFETLMQKPNFFKQVIFFTVTDVAHSWASAGANCIMTHTTQVILFHEIISFSDQLLSNQDDESKK